MWTICQLALDPEDALIYATRLQPDGILVNFDMLPYGVLFIRQLREASPRSKFIIETKDAQSLIGEANNDIIILQSPVRAKELFQALNKISLPLGEEPKRPLGLLKTDRRYSPFSEVKAG